MRLIKVSFRVNKGKKLGDLGYCPVNRERPLSTGFTVSPYPNSFTGNQNDSLKETKFPKIVSKEILV